MDKILKKIIWVVLAAPAIYLAIIWSKLPDRIAIGAKEDGFSSKYWLILCIGIMILVGWAIYWFMPRMHRVDRKKTAVQNKDHLFRMGFAYAVFISFMACYFIQNTSEGGTPLNMRLAWGAGGLIWCLYGNYIYTLKPNSFAGIQLRWTKNNDENWRRTHRFAGKLWFAGGLILVVACLFMAKSIILIAFLTVVLLFTALPRIYSYWFYRKQKTIHSSHT